jgi:hypothetical protein
MKLLFPSSNIPSNIGNAFFYEGIKYVVSSLTTPVELVVEAFPPDNPFGLKSAQRSKYFDPIFDAGEVDGILIAGPVLDKEFVNQFGAQLRNFRKKGKLIVMLSIGGRAYDDEEIGVCREFLKEVSPDILITRDTDTFANYGDCAKRSYDGVCFASFSSEYYKGYAPANSEKYVASCFDFGPEPDLNTIGELKVFGGEREALRHPGKKTHSKWANAMHLLQRRFADAPAGMEVIRPCHRPTRNTGMLFFKPNSFSCHVPEPYLNIYKYAGLVVTDRLHAAVVSLMFGRPVQLFLDSNRVRLLDRLGFTACLKGVYKADLEEIGKEKRAQIDWLEAAVSGVMN